MPIYVEYDLENGQKILIEASMAGPDRVTRASGIGEDVIIKSKKSFSDSFADVKTQAKTLIKQFDELPVSEAEIKFGIIVNGELGNMIIGKVGLGVNYELFPSFLKMSIDRLSLIMTPLILIFIGISS